MDLGSVEGERSAAALESWRQVDVPRNDPAVEQRVHAITDVVLCDGRRVRERVIPELLRQDALRLIDFSALPLTDAELLKLNIADSTLAPAVFELVGRRQAKLRSNQAVAVEVLGIARQKGILLLLHDLLQCSVHHVVRQWLLI